MDEEKLTEGRGLMTKKEKIIVVFYILSMVLVIASCIYTCNLNKPEGYIFNIERVLRKVF